MAIDFEPNMLPSDVVFKGYKSIIIQNIKLETDNIEYQLAHYYSPSTKTHYTAELPSDVQNTQFGSDLKALIVELYYIGRTPENKIHQILTDQGIIISNGEISNILTREKCDVLTQEKKEIFEAGMRRAKYVQTDETGARHQGNNYHTHYIGNDQFSTYYIEEHKSRGVVRELFGLLDGVLMPTPFVSDGAKQYNGISIYHGLCWIHEIRYYKKIKPYMDCHRLLLDNFISEIWEFYDLLTRYKSDPDRNIKTLIEQQFVSLFTRETGFIELDKRIALTFKNRDNLLTVLEVPEIPLHNNGSEIAVREWVIKRKISYGTRSELGKTAWENYLSIESFDLPKSFTSYKFLR